MVPASGLQTKSWCPGFYHSRAGGQVMGCSLDIRQSTWQQCSWGSPVVLQSSQDTLPAQAAPAMPVEHTGPEVTQGEGQSAGWGSGRAPPASPTPEPRGPQFDQQARCCPQRLHGCP